MTQDQLAQMPDPICHFCHAKSGVPGSVFYMGRDRKTACEEHRWDPWFEREPLPVAPPLNQTRRSER